MNYLRRRIGRHCSLLIALALCPMTGCEQTETAKFSDLSARGAKYTLNDQGEVTGLYLYSDEEHTFGDDDIQFLQDYPTVQLLLIESTALTDAGLRHVKVLNQLKELDLTFCQGEEGDGGKRIGGITDAAIDLLLEMPNLKQIGLQQTRVTDAGVDRLQRALPECRINYNYSDPVLAAMRQSGKGLIPVLKAMRAEVSFAEKTTNDTTEPDESKPIDLKLGTTDLVLRYIAENKSLKSLTLRGPFTSAGLVHLVELPELTSLDIADSSGRRQIDADTMNTLVSLSKLTSLDISGNQLNDAELLKLQKLTGLKSLKLVGCPVTDRTINSLKKALLSCEITHSSDPLLNALLNNGGDLSAAVESVATSVERSSGGDLVAAEFRLERISDKGLEELKKLKTLEQLQFTYCRRFSDEGAKHIGALPNLKSLTLSHSSLGNRGVANIAALSKLQQLDLSTNRVGSRSRQPIDDSGMRDLATLKELSNLSLRGTEISDTGLRRLESLENLKSLDIRATRITQDGLRRFKKKLPNCEVLF